MIGMGTNFGCLRREYLRNKETVASLPNGKDDFFFFVYGQRLSSLYRAANIARFWLTKGYLPSLFLKYSNADLLKRN